MTHNESHVCTGIPKPNWKYNTPSETNALGNRHSRDAILQVQPIKSSLLPGSFLGVAAALSPALSVPFVAHPCASIRFTELSSTCLCSILKHCCAPEHLIAGGGALLSCPLWGLSSGHWDSVWSKWSEPTEKNFRPCGPQQLHCGL